MPDKETLDRFGEAVEEKKQKAEEASHHPRQEPVQGIDVNADDEQSARVDAAHTQDDRDVRAKNSGKGQVTADKWNQ
jgi:hypothetical protein